MYFGYGNTEIEHLKNKDKILAEVIGKIGHIYRMVDDDIDIPNKACHRSKNVV